MFVTLWTYNATLTPMLKVAIICICTGKYAQFFDGLYRTCEKNFLPGEAEKEYFVFTDDCSLSGEPNVHLIERKCQGFPLDTLFRYDMILSQEEALARMDYVYFFNSNSEFLLPIGREVLPETEDQIVACEWPKKHRQFYLPFTFPYERNKKSTAYISPYDGGGRFHYHMGSFNGGHAAAYLQMSHTLAENIRSDWDRGIVAIVHDESHLNKYLRSHPCKILPREWHYPEEWLDGKFVPRVGLRHKVSVDKYFDKGRKHSQWARTKRTFQRVWRAIQWYI